MSDQNKETNPVRILIVEDDPIFRESLLILFETYPNEWTCTIADSIIDAELLLADQSFDMGILDIHLPDGDALDLIRIAGTLPCILFTQDSEEPTFKKMIDDPTLSQNIVGYLIKPLQQGVILSIRASWRIAKERKMRNHLVAEATAELEDERRILAQELHDSMGALLTQLTWIFSGIAKETTLPSIPPEVAHKISSMCEQGKQVVAGAHEEASQIVTRLRPEAVNVAGLRVAIEFLVEEWQTAAPGVVFELKLAAELDQIDLRRAGIIYRLIQEGVTNAMRHTEPTKIKIFIGEKEERLTLKVYSEGRVLVEKDTYKLTVLRERTSSLGGDLQFNCNATQGMSSLVISIPL